MFILSISRAFMPGYSMLACLDNFEPRTVINRVNFARKSIFGRPVEMGLELLI